MKAAARSTTTPLPQIYSQKAIQQDQVSTSTLLPEACLSASLYRAWRQQALPHTLQDLTVIPEVFANIGPNCNKRFLLSNTLDTPNGHLIFASEEALRWLSDCQRWHMDGTFKAAPRLFTQLFTIQVVKEKKIIHCAYCLLPSKRKQCYQNVLAAIKDAAGERHLPATAGLCGN